MKRINVTRSSMPSIDEYIEEIRPLWESRWLSNRGTIAVTFEEQLKEYLGAKYISLFANGHVALEVAINAYNFPKESEIITTPYTFVSTTHSIVRNGLKPVFCDVSEDNYCIDPKRIESLITDKTVAIMGTHVYGEVCDVERIQKIADDYKLKVFYDAAHAFGVKYKGKGVAEYGDFTMFSTHATKVFHTIEGGVVSFKDESVYSVIDKLTNFGFDGPEQVAYISTNAKMNEFEAAMGVCNLRHLDEEISKRKRVHDRYIANLSGVTGISFIRPDENVYPNYSYMPVFFDGYRMTRDEVQNRLKEKDIYARKYFYPLTSEMKCYEKEYLTSVSNTPIAKWASEHVLALPMYASLEGQDVDYICDIICS